MAASVNRVLILGNLGQDPEIRYTPGGTAVCNFSVATTEAWSDKDGNKQESTEWHRVVVWSKQAENCAKFLSKGRTVFVEGRLQTRSWDDKTSGQKRYATEIIAQNIQFIGSGARDQNSQTNGSSKSLYNTDNFAPQPEQNSHFGSPSMPSLDDIPF